MQLACGHAGRFAFLCSSGRTELRLHAVFHRQLKNFRIGGSVNGGAVCVMEGIITPPCS
jgi:hypothetical protein